MKLTLLLLAQAQCRQIFYNARITDDRRSFVAKPVNAELINIKNKRDVMSTRKARTIQFLPSLCQYKGKATLHCRGMTINNHHAYVTIHPQKK